MLSWINLLEVLFKQKSQKGQNTFTVLMSKKRTFERDTYRDLHEHSTKDDEGSVLVTVATAG